MIVINTLSVHTMTNLGLMSILYEYIQKVLQMILLSFVLST